ncbi:MAG TPA: hypothetical protein VMM13_06030 [Euzebya sp.]|nr:hypothetical protein [Euzebya sp.]
MSWGDTWRAVLGGSEGARAAASGDGTPAAGPGDGTQSREVYELQRRVRQGTATYRSGRVSDVRLGIGRVSARVQGSRATPFLVEVEIPVLADAAWDVVLDLLASRVRYSARLLAGQHPEGLIEEAAEQGVRLVPTREEISVAAGHSGEDPFPVAGAAVWEAVAARLDASPFPLLQLRGRGRERILRDIARRRRAGGDGTAEGVATDDIAVLGWSTESAQLDAISIPSLQRPRLDAPALRVLGEPDGWAGALSPADLLSPLVAGAAEMATDLLVGPPPAEDADDV